MASILIVDDCRPIAMILARHLTFAGHKVRTAHDGASALTHIEREMPDCIVLDLMMPVMTGTELLHTLKQRPDTADVPIVLVSARVGEGRTHVLSEREADISVGKPFTRNQVVQAVAMAMSERADARGSAFAVA